MDPELGHGGVARGSCGTSTPTCHGAGRVRSRREARRRRRGVPAGDGCAWGRHVPGRAQATLGGDHVSFMPMRLCAASMSVYLCLHVRVRVRLRIRLWPKPLMPSLLRASFQKPLSRPGLAPREKGTTRPPRAIRSSRPREELIINFFEDEFQSSTIHRTLILGKVPRARVVGPASLVLDALNDVVHDMANLAPELGMA